MDVDRQLPTIIIVEDSPTQAQQVAARLSDQEVCVMLAGDGPQALRLISTVHPALVVLDINLPTMDGFQVCKRLKRDPETSHIPVIMLTSATHDEDRVRGMQAGAFAYITKDQCAVENLLQVIEQLGIAKSHL